ncbi:hypothetical protein [Chamaesiphon sp. VAR_48_metabat_135_sub]|uniref:hypothetical protein n=1 Tax=Chamaesiphon sp. VAR_48_metabat_135_sub TaxID=2964699 RepID=UPI00286B3164|nr:hypothetical protein [Chamaesiphon sp. VAR_48_metabat_135_sub]
MRQVKLSLLVLTTILATSLSIQTDRASAQDAPQQVDILGAGVKLLTNFINGDPAKTAADAEVRKAEIAAKAEIEKERMRIEANKNTDSLTPMLNKWGVSKIPCGSGVVVINIGPDTVCIQPTAATPAGYYTFDSTKQKLVRSGSSAKSGNTAQSSPVQSNPAPSNTNQSASNTSNNTNVQTVQTTHTNNGSRVKTTQTTKVTGSGHSEGGF